MKPVFYGFTNFILLIVKIGAEGGGVIVGHLRQNSETSGVRLIFAALIW